MLAPGPARTSASSRQFASRPDRELIAACLSGNEQAWNTLIERYKALIYKVALHMGLPAADAADVLQEVCLRLVQHLSDLRDTSKLSQWLIITTKREVWQRLRQRDPVVTLASIEYDPSTDGKHSPSADNSPLPEENLLQLEDEALVRQAMECLPDRCRSLLTLLYFQDPPCSYAETARCLQMPLNSVGPNRVRCLKHLKKILADLGF